MKHLVLYPRSVEPNGGANGITDWEVLESEAEEETAGVPARLAQERRKQKVPTGGRKYYTHVQWSQYRGC